MEPLPDNTTPERPTTAAGRRMPLAGAACLWAVAVCAAGLHFYRPGTPTLTTSTPGPQVLRSAMAVPNRAPAAHKQHTLWHQIGLASWYGPRFQGRETANGETFNMNDLTCAHRFLPLGTWVKVTNLHTRKWIVVRVNDRGPAPETRIADLSSQAARMLGMHARGVTRVRLDVIDPRQAVEVARLDKLRLARLAAEESLPDVTTETAPLQPLAQ